jgi:hypothetical protein
MAPTYTPIYGSVELLVQSIIVDCNIDQDKYPTLAFTTANGPSIYQFDPALDTEGTDNAGDINEATFEEQHIPINWNYKTGFTSNATGETYTFSHARIRANLYSGESISLGIAEIDETNYTDLGELPEITANPSKRFTVPIGNKVAEQVSIEISGVGAAQINSLTIFVAEKAQDYPR